MGLIPQTRTFFGRFSIYMGAGVLQQLVGFALLPYFSYFLTPAEVGTLSVLMAMETLLLILLDFGLTPVAVRYFHQHRETVSNLVIGRLFLVSVIGAASLAVLLFLVMTLTWDHWTDLPQPPTLLLGVLVLSAFVQRINLFAQQMYRTREQAWQFCAMVVSRAILLLVLSLGLVGLFHLALLGVFLARLLAALATAVTETRALLRPAFSTDGEKELPSLWPLWRMGAPLLVQQLNNWGRGYLDRFFLSNIVEAPAIGVYFMAGLPGMVFAFIALTFDQTFAPWYYRRRQANEAGFSALSSDINSLFLTGFGILFVGAMSICPELFHVLFSKGLEGAGSLAPLLMAGQFVGSAAQFFNKVLLFHNRTAIVPVIGLVGVVCGLCLLLLLAGKIGLVAGAAALVTTNLIALCGSWLAVRRLEVPDFSIGRAIAFAAVVGGFAIFVHLNAVAMEWHSLSLRLGVAALCAVVMIALCGRSARARAILLARRIRH